MCQTCSILVVWGLTCLQWIDWILLDSQSTMATQPIHGLRISRYHNDFDRINAFNAVQNLLCTIGVLLDENLICTIGAPKVVQNLVRSIAASLGDPKLWTREPNLRRRTLLGNEWSSQSSQLLLPRTTLSSYCWNCTLHSGLPWSQQGQTSSWQGQFLLLGWPWCRLVCVDNVGFGVLLSCSACISKCLPRARDSLNDFGDREAKTCTNPETTGNWPNDLLA